ncbi:MAG: hypothetical protein ACOY93_04665 [Bacillota bacterium]
MRSLRKGLSVLLVLFIVPILMGQIALHSARSLLSDPAFPKQVIREAGVQAEVERWMLAALREQVRPEQFGVSLSRERLNRIIHRILPPAQLTAMGEQVVDGLVAWAWGEEPYPNLVLDLTEVRRGVIPAVRAELQAEVDSLPVCTREQLLQLAKSPPTGIPPCKTADKRLNDAFVEAMLRRLDLERLLPLQVDLAAAIADRQGPDFWTGAWQEIQAIRAGLDLILWGWAVVTLLLLVLLLLNLDRWYAPLGWLGAVGILAGGPLALAGAGGPLVGRLVQPWLPTEGQGVASAAVQIGLRAVTEAVQGLSFTVLLAGLAVVAVAVYGRMTDPPPERAGM